MKRQHGRFDTEEEREQERKRKRNETCILSYEGYRVPIVQYQAEVLTEFIRTKHSLGLTHLVVVENAAQRLASGLYSDSLHVTNDPTKYLKKIVHSTSEFKGIDTDLMIIMAHGFPANAGNSSILNFHDTDGEHNAAYYGKWTAEKKTDALVVSARRRGAVFYQSESNVVTLQDLTKKTKLVILLSCSGDTIMADYLSENASDDSRPDFLVSNKPEIREFSTCLLCEMLFSFVNFQYADTTFSHPPENHWRIVRNCILGIFAIVKIFRDDHQGFWEYLRATHFIVTLEDDLKNRQLAHPGRTHHNGVRVAGHHIYFEFLPEIIFDDFRTLLLVTPSGNISSANITEKMEIKLSPLDGVDTFLKTYTAAHPVLAEAAHPVHAETLLQMRACLSQRRYEKKASQ
jgi:hypothetical protein